MGVATIECMGNSDFKNIARFTILHVKLGIAKLNMAMSSLEIQI